MGYDLEIGKVLDGRFKLTALLSQGGMATGFRAESACGLTAVRRYDAHMRRFSRIFTLATLLLLPIAIGLFHWRALAIHSRTYFVVFTGPRVVITHGYRLIASERFTEWGYYFAANDPPGLLDYCVPIAEESTGFQLLAIPWLWIVAGWAGITALVWQKTKPGRPAAFPVSLNSSLPASKSPATTGTGQETSGAHRAG